MRYTAPEIEKMLSSIVLLTDSRERATKSFYRRVETISWQYERVKLDEGDYTCYVIDSIGNKISLENIVVCERKLSCDELAACFSSDRVRFRRQMERSKAKACKVHLITEDGSYEKILNGKYNSKISPQAFMASLMSWCSRYNLSLHFCKAETTPFIIRNILYYAMQNYLLSLERSE